jgi:hypothetical protein
MDIGRLDSRMDHMSSALGSVALAFPALRWTAILYLEAGSMHGETRKELDLHATYASDKRSEKTVRTCLPVVCATFTEGTRRGSGGRSDMPAE